MKCDVPAGNSISMSAIKFSVKGMRVLPPFSFIHCYIDGLERRVILSEKIQRINPDLGCACLLVVAPDHGNLRYTWERKDDSKWVSVIVPKDTCLLYTRCEGMHSCKVSGEVYYFKVTGL